MKNLTRKIVLFLVRKKLKVDKYVLFRFPDQLSTNAVYFFDDTGLKKTWLSKGEQILESGVRSNVSLNWLLDDNCKIDILEESGCV